MILKLASGVVSAESFTFNGSNPVVRSNGATLAGNVVLDAVGKIGIHPSGPGPLTVSGDISGSITGTGELDIATDVILSGTNTYLAVNRVIANGSLTAGSSTGISPNSTAEILQGTLDLNGFDASVGDLEAPSNATGTIDIGTGTLTIGSSNQSLAYLGSLTGTGNLIKTGTGTQALSGTSTFSGTTTVAGGELDVDGTLPSTVIIASGASLSGSGTVGATAIQSGGAITPGNSPGILNTGDFDLQAGSTLEIEIGGVNAGNTSTDHDQVNVTGTVTLAGSLDTLQFNGFIPSVGDEFTIINNDGADAISGTFNGLPEGATISNFLGTGLGFVISYEGGDGNDVVLAAAATSVSVADGVLQITDTNSTGTTDSLTITTDAGDIVVTDSINVITAPGLTGDGTNAIRVPIASITSNQILINTGAASDSVVIDSTFNPGSTFDVTIDGGSGTDSVTWASTNSLAAISVVSEAINLSSNVTTTGTQAWDGAATLAANVNLSGAGISFTDSIDGAFNLSVSSTGGQQTTFGGAIGDTTPLNFLQTFGVVEFQGGGSHNRWQSRLPQRRISGFGNQPDDVHKYRRWNNQLWSGHQRIRSQRDER